jgi:hypothetical protein
MFGHQYSLCRMVKLGRHYDTVRGLRLHVNPSGYSNDYDHVTGRGAEMTIGHTFSRLPPEVDR